jgi:alpha-L-rhamnosidase
MVIRSLLPHRALALLLLVTVGVAADLQPSRLRCEYLADPLGIDEATPHLSWACAAADVQARSLSQQAYHLVVASTREQARTGHGDLWDSGRVESAQTTQVTYAGKPLTSLQRCWWSVRIWDQAGGASSWSEPASFTMGMLDRARWTATWIGVAQEQVISLPGVAPGPATKKPVVLLPATHLRRSFTLAAPPVRAVLVASALGHVDLHLNGRRVSEEHFAPGWSDYRKSACYRAYDVTAAMNAGENVLGAVLADGWFRGQVSVLGQNRYGSKTRFLAQLHLFAADGSEQVIVSDDTWRSSTGPILEGDLFAGETYDARRELTGWDAPGYDANAWAPVAVGAEVKPTLRFYRSPPVRAQEDLPPVAIEQRPDGSYIIDLGQNIAGWVRLKVEETAGTMITLRFAEMRNRDGSLYTAALRSARATDTYVCRGGGVEVWEPRFTYHGFRFVEVRGLSRAPSRDTITGVVAHSDLPLTSSFACSSDLVNRIHANSWWGQRGNYLDLPTDCPQRDERMGWTGDTQVYVRTAAWHMEVAPFLARWMDEMADAQTADGRFPIMAPAAHEGWSPGWADAGVIVPWTMYQVYGDTALLARHYERMKAHVAYYRSRSSELIAPGEGFGDWLAVGSDTPKDLISTAYFAHSARLLVDIATALGHAEDASANRELADKVSAAFQRKWVREDGTIGSGSQTGYLLALRFGLLTTAQREQATTQLVAAIAAKNDHLSTGFLGVNLLLPTLSDTRHSDIAYRLLQNTTYPSWGYSIAQGATTMWERWNSYTHDAGFGDVGMNSFNHYAYGACNEWLYGTVLGIAPATPGFTTIDLHPEPGGGLTWAKGQYQSLHGTIASGWTVADGSFTWDVTVPPNTSAVVHLPGNDPALVREDAKDLSGLKGLTVLSGSGEPIRARLGSGTYHFTVLPR